jgi:hypothetical protein
MFNINTIKDHLAWLEQNYLDSDAEYEMILLLRAMLKNEQIVELVKELKA